ncbi:hypothetical protein B0T17DRAFT_327137 [Bombardia bombarda]|uniref:HMG box domain-containing protein n=1 Tax=Bombardia bombarda TaxID=252184 RepID=A0AA39WMN2_9PEZI|nr:hypothetical protein B0T17DRAFT_327137 [Bombardia bombarda]
MTQQLDAIFGELGISHYLDAFVDQGFDSWETILDITESDLDALGVKLGHRRKLQRRIANSRGVAPDISLVPSSQPTIEESRGPDPLKAEAPKFDVRETNTTIATKRKYRRHPKPDDNAPERPPSAYVLFSNKMREDLKGRNLTFTEIAKLVGENWQSLSTAEKEPFESQAQKVKERYQFDLTDYKKTTSYQKYMAYLHDFKAKHSLPSQDKDTSKRIKLSESGGTISGSANATPNRTSRSGSGSSHPGSEPPPTRQQRIGSTVSVNGSQHSASPTPGSYHASSDEPLNSPITTTERSPILGISQRDLPSLPGQRNPSWADDQRPDHSGIQRHLPSLAEFFDGPGILNSMPHANETNGYPFPRSYHADSPGPPPSLVSVDSTTKPPFRHEQSSTGSTSSSSSYGYPRTPLEGPLPIHALLAPDPAHLYDANRQQQQQQQPVFHLASSSREQTQPFVHTPTNGTSLPKINGYHREPAGSRPSVNIHHSSSSLGYGTNGVSPTTNGAQDRKQGAANFDGMNALLKAGEIVDRRAQ